MIISCVLIQSCKKAQPNFQKANELFKQGKFLEAVKSYDNALKNKEISKPDAYFAIGK